VAVVDAWAFEIPSTKAAIAALGSLGATGRVLVVLGDGDGIADRSFGNLPEVQTIMAGELNAYDILVNDWLVFTDETLPGGTTSEATGAVPEPGETETADAAGSATDVAGEEGSGS
jgi:large subunit ribosomal protein L4